MKNASTPGTRKGHRLSYDHGIMDAVGSVNFPVGVKELPENPGQLLIRKDPVKTLLEL